MKQHKYTHLGIAPYRLVNAFYDPPVQDANGAWHGGMNQCDHCQRPISYVFVCKSSDGKEFNLGSVHVEELGDEGLTQAVLTKAQQMKKEAAAEVRRIKFQKMWEEQNERQAIERAKNQAKMEKELPLAIEFLATLPHPNAYFAKRGKTMKDYVEYCRFTKGYIIVLAKNRGLS